MPYSPYMYILLLGLHLCAKFLSNRTITYGDIAFWRFGGYKSVINECSLGVNLVIDYYCFYVASDTSPLYHIWKQSEHYLWRYFILKIWGIQVSFGCERSYSSARRVSNFNSKVPTYKIYVEIRWIFLELLVFTSSGSTGGGHRHGDAKTITLRSVI